MKEKQTLNTLALRFSFWNKRIGILFDLIQNQSLASTFTTSN